MSLKYYLIMGFQIFFTVSTLLVRYLTIYSIQVIILILNYTGDEKYRFVPK